MKTKPNTFEQVILECYRELFSNSVTYDGSTGDFDKLYESASSDESGRKNIPFMDYFIEEQLLNDITTKWANHNDIKNGDRQKFINTVYLGPSPCSSREGWEKNKK